MSLTSYRAAPPRVGVLCLVCVCGGCACVGVVCGCVGRPGGDRLSRTLGCSIMGAGGFHVRVRDGIGWGAAARATRSSDATTRRGAVWRRAGCRFWYPLVVFDVGLCVLAWDGLPAGCRRRVFGLRGSGVRRRRRSINKWLIGRCRGIAAVQGGRCFVSRSGD